MRMLSVRLETRGSREHAHSSMRDKTTILFYEVITEINKHKTEGNTMTRFETEALGNDVLLSTDN